jgi:hypothetical protein
VESVTSRLRDRLTVFDYYLSRIQYVCVYKSTIDVSMTRLHTCVSTMFFIYNTPLEHVIEY